MLNNNLFEENGALNVTPNDFAYFNNITKLRVNQNIISNELDVNIDKDYESKILPSYIKIEEDKIEIVCDRLVSKNAKVSYDVKPYKLDELKEIAKQNKININGINKDQIVKVLRTTFCKAYDY